MKKAMLLLFFLLFSITLSATQLEVENGKVTIPELYSNKTFSLNGNWEFYWNDFLFSEDFNTREEQKNYIKVPSYWKGYLLNGEKLPSQGFATIRTTVKGLKVGEIYGIYPGEIVCAYRLFINGKELFNAGRVGKSESEEIPAYFPKVIYFQASQENEIIIQMSNFHYKIGGTWSEIIIGNSDIMSHFRDLRIGFDLFSAGTLIIMFFYHLGLFSLRRKEKSNIIFAFCCLFSGIRPFSSGQYFFLTLFPNFDWNWLVKLDFLTIYGCISMFGLLIKSLYPEETSDFFVRPLIFITATLSLLVIFTSPMIYSNFVTFYQCIIILSGIYITFVLIKSIKNKRLGAKIILSGFSIVFFAVIYDILAINNIISYFTYIAPFSIFLFIFMQSFVLSMRFSNAFNTIESLSMDLKRYSIELETSNAALKKAIDTKLESMLNLAKSLVHELKTPLVGIKGFAEMTKKKFGSVDKKIIYYMDNIKMEADRVDDMAKDLLEYSGLNENILSKEDLKLKLLIDRCIKLKSQELADNNIDIFVSVDENIEISADRQKIEKVFMSLLKNSIESMVTEKEEKYIKIFATSSEKAEIVVEDNGAGIPDNIKDKIFEPLFTTKIQGTGLGLSIVKGIIEKHAGNIEVNSEEGKGTIVRFWL